MALRIVVSVGGGALAGFGYHLLMKSVGSQ